MLCRVKVGKYYVEIETSVVKLYRILHTKFRLMITSEEGGPETVKIMIIFVKEVICTDICITIHVYVYVIIIFVGTNI